MKQKRLYAILLASLVLAVGCVNIDDIVITSPDLNRIADGTYRGSSKVGPVRVTLDVSTRDSAISSIQIVKHFNGRGKKAEEIVPVIIRAQSLEVDVISGATFSSKAILLAAEKALGGE